MFWWILFGLSFLFLTGSIICGVRNNWCSSRYVSSTVTSLIVTGLLFTGAVLLPSQGVTDIAEMQESKNFIEQNWSSIDESEWTDIETLALSLEVRDAYFQYQFRLSNMKNSQDSYGILSKYYGHNLESLELEVRS